MSWTWRAQKHDGTVVDAVPIPTFDSQSDAESWVGEEFEELLSLGIDTVTLLEDDRVIYADMSLHPA